MGNSIAEISHMYSNDNNKMTYSIRRSMLLSSLSVRPVTVTQDGSFHSPLSKFPWPATGITNSSAQEGNCICYPTNLFPIWQSSTVVSELHQTALSADFVVLESRIIRSGREMFVNKRNMHLEVECVEGKVGLFPWLKTSLRFSHSWNDGKNKQLYEALLDRT